MVEYSPKRVPEGTCECRGAEKEGTRCLMTGNGRILCPECFLPIPNQLEMENDTRLPSSSSRGEIPMVTSPDLSERDRSGDTEEEVRPHRLREGDMS